LGIVTALLFGLSTASVRAAATTIGDVLPIDNIATPAIEGIPSAGNGWNALEPNDAQTRWENNTVVLGYEAIQAGIVVGQKLPMGGRLDIDGNTNLRYQTLVIGDQGELANGQLRTGTGTVLITGIGALFSNDPTSLPPSLPNPLVSPAPPSMRRSLTFGFDLYVGRFGLGTFELRNGGRAEIQDAVVVGDQLGSNGVITVDGFGSILASGGFDGGDITEVHQMLVGRRGTGTMYVRNGGTVVSEASPAGAASGDDIVGAVIGSDPFLDNEEPVAGGTGLVVVGGSTALGVTSRWSVGGSLQIGGFHNSTQGALEDPAGVFVEYNSEVGRGTLKIQDGGLVTIRPALEADVEDDDLLLAIGRFGRLEMEGGRLVHGTDEGTDEDDAVPDSVQLLNDGVITGSGRIETGVFVNRYVGEVRIDPGQSLIIDSASEFDATVPGQPPPLVNFGVIRVLGTADQRAYLEFERSPETLEEDIQPFRNSRIERPMGAPLGDFFGGLISGQHSNLIFRSDLENTGLITFTDGMNYVVGDVFNIGPPAVPFSERGIIRISGPNTRVIFENDLINTGTIIVAGGASFEVLARHSFMTANELTLDVDPSKGPPISTTGDVGIAGSLHVNLLNIAPGSLVDGTVIPLITFDGEIGGVDLSDPFRPTIDLDAAPLFSAFSFTPSAATLGLAPGLVIIPEFTLSTVQLAVRSTVGHIGPDFNGDGVVDVLDLEIWKMNMGITMGATVLQGDANGDGAVDAADYLIWLEVFTMGPGAGSGGFAQPNGTVPEPTGLAMLALGGLLTLALGRRRHT
jgi:T5SS/PEP-CTERM-associated repeat protein